MRSLGPALGLALLVAGAVALLAAIDAQTAEQRHARAEQDALRALYDFLPVELRSSAFRLERRLDTLDDGVTRHWTLVRGADGRAVAAAASASAVGYGGELVVETLVDADGRLLGARVLSHTETLAYASALLAHWNPAAAQPDALTGATISRDALTAASETARLRTQQLLSELAGNAQ